jgi:two-component system phosphate regulon sensor histidine kinase PhoR
MYMKFQKKLLFSFLFLVAITFCVNYYSFDPVIRSFFVAESTEEFLKQAKVARLLIMASASKGATPQLIARKIGKELNARVTIVDRQGEVIGDSSLKVPELERLDNHLQRPEIRDALRNGSGHAVRYSDTLKTPMVYAAVFFDDGVSSGVVRVSRPLTHVSARMAKLHMMAGKVLLLTMLVALVLSVVISRIISRPLVEMADFATSITSQEQYRHISLKSRDEIGTLAGALNSMGDRITSQFQALESEKSRLDTILRGMGEGVMVVLTDGTITLVNPPFQSLFSFRGDEEGKNIRETLDIPEMIATFDEVQEQGKELVREFQIQDAGTTLLTHWVPLKVHEGGEGVVVVFHDITERKHYEEALARSEDRFRSVVECSLTGMHFYSLEADNRLLLTGANPAADSILGISHWPLVGSDVEEAFPELKGHFLLDLYRRVAAGKLGPQSLEHERRFENETRHYDLRVFRTGPGAISVEFADITERTRMQEELREASERDPLTSLYNRRKLCQLLTGELKRTRRHGHPLTLMLLDIDHFKRINDTFGHDIGDLVLAQAAQLISAMLRLTDILARYGGEEFVIACPETDMDGAAVLAEKIRSSIEEFPAPKSGKITISVGVSLLKNGDDVDTLIKRADKALYAAKEMGRNRVVRSTEDGCPNPSSHACNL